MQRGQVSLNGLTVESWQTRILYEVSSNAVSLKSAFCDLVTARILHLNRADDSWAIVCRRKPLTLSCVGGKGKLSGLRAIPQLSWVGESYSLRLSSGRDGARGIQHSSKSIYEIGELGIDCDTRRVEDLRLSRRQVVSEPYVEGVWKRLVPDLGVTRVYEVVDLANRQSI